MVLYILIIGTIDQIDHCSSDNPTSILPMVMWICLLANICLCALLELLFKHPTNLIQTVELFQILSFGYYISTMYPYDMDATYLQMLNIHPAQLIPPIYLPADANVKATGKFAKAGFMGYIIFDGQGILLGYIVLLILASIPKIIKNIVNPRKSKLTYNACDWTLKKLTLCGLIWFRFTVMILFASTIITFQDFSWND
jgi:hypothetical protein